MTQPSEQRTNEQETALGDLGNSRAAQGLPPMVEDAEALRLLAVMVGRALQRAHGTDAA